MLTEKIPKSQAKDGTRRYKKKGVPTFLFPIKKTTSLAFSIGRVETSFPVVAWKKKIREI